VISLFIPNFPLSYPVMILWLYAYKIALVYHLPLDTSLKGLLLVTLGAPSIRYSAVISIARVREDCGANLSVAVPVIIETLARCLLPAIRSYFESDEGQREFAEWQARQNAEQSIGGEVKSDEQVRRTA
jgi:hypothetical protein